MHPFYFGRSDRQLYGVHHPPRGRSRRRKAVLLCYPFGFEYMRAHRAFRQLANLLSRGGAHVLRFDYYGTGDSAGAGTDATLEQWLSDVGSAADELQANAGTDSVDVVGLRLGASIAALAARSREDVDRLVLWDPVVEGRAYVEELGVPAAAGTPDVTGVTGFPLTGELAEEIAGIDLLAADYTNPSRLDLLVSEERAPYRELVRRWAEGNLPYGHRHIPSQSDWSEGDEFGSALLPQDMIQGIVETVMEER